MLLHYLVIVETLQNVILHCDITKENMHQIKCIIQLHRNGPVDYKIWGVTQQCVYETKICGINNLQKFSIQTWFDSEQNVIEAATDQWHDSLRSLCVLMA